MCIRFWHLLKFTFIEILLSSIYISSDVLQYVAWNFRETYVSLTCWTNWEDAISILAKRITPYYVMLFYCVLFNCTEFTRMCLVLCVVLSIKNCVIIIVYLSWRWATCWPVRVLRIQMSLKMSSMMRNTVAYPTQKSSSPSRGIPCSHKRGNDDRVTAV